MGSRNDLDLETKINLIREKERGSSHRELKDKFHVSIGSITNILKRKHEYISDYESNLNKKVKRKFHNDLSQTINDTVYEWFVSQRAKKIPVSGPILQAYAKNVAQELGDSSGFKASNGWLERFRVRYNVRFRVISGEGAAVNDNTVHDWISRLPQILQNYNPNDVYNCDETGLFFKLMPDRSLVVNADDCIGGKKSKERFTVLLCTNWLGTDKLKPMVIGKAARPRCFRNLNMAKMPVTWCYNRSAWMNSILFTNWLNELDANMRKQNRKILLFLDNAPVHPPDIKLHNINLKFFPANTTARIQPLDQGLIQNFKANYRRQLVQHVIAHSSSTYSTEDVIITALDAICWIDSAWKSITDVIIQNTFRKAGFDLSAFSQDPNRIEVSSNNDDIITIEKNSLDELDKVLKRVTINGDIMSAADFVQIDDDVPVFNQWNDGTEKVLAVSCVNGDDTVNDEDTNSEHPPTLSEAITMVKRLYLFSTIHHPELHSFTTQLQSKLVDIYLDSNCSKQKSITDFFKPKGL